LAEYSRTAEAKAEEATALETIPDVDQYLIEHDALNEEALQDLLP